MAKGEYEVVDLHDGRYALNKNGITVAIVYSQEGIKELEELVRLNRQA